MDSNPQVHTHHIQHPNATVTRWIKTTKPWRWVRFRHPQLFTTSAGNFVKQSVVYGQDTAPAGTTSDVVQDGTSATARTIVDGDIWLDLDATGGQIQLIDMTALVTALIKLQLILQ